MKKLMMMILLMVVGFAVIGAPSFYDCKSKADVENAIANSKVSEASKQILRKLIDKDPSNLSFDELKKIVSDTVNSSSIKNKKLFIENTIICMCMYHNSRFGKYAINVKNDEDMRKNYLFLHYYPSHQKSIFTDSELLEIYKELLKGNERDKSAYGKIHFKSHMNIINKLPSTEALKELKEVKRYTYPLIGNEEWKKLVVEVELMIKSLE